MHACCIAKQGTIRNTVSLCTSMRHCFEFVYKSRFVSVHSNHCRAMGCRIEILGEMDVARVEPNQPGQGDPHCTRQLVRTTPASGGHQLPGCGSRSASKPVAVGDVHQARIRSGVGGWRVTHDEHKRGISDALCLHFVATYISQCICISVL